MKLDSFPKSDGFRMPGEFEPHEKCWMLWPERSDMWRCGGIFAQRTFAEIANIISKYEPMTVGVSFRNYENARKLLNDQVRVVEISYNDSWIRDCGPTFLKNDQGELRGVDWKFNAWGGLAGGMYTEWHEDDLVAQKVLEIEGIARYRTDNFVLEGGSIHVDGQGTLITTEQCLLNINRNPFMTKESIEDMLYNYLNVEKIIWLKSGLFNDETDGHVDNLCCFARPGEVVLAWSDDPSHPSYHICQEAYKTLENATDAKGRKFVIHKMILPHSVTITEEEFHQINYISTVSRTKPGEQLAASYVNFLICNGAIIMPIFDDVRDSMAVQKMKEIFPEYQVETIQSREVILGGGNIHCITQQQPKRD